MNSRHLIALLQIIPLLLLGCPEESDDDVTDDDDLVDDDDVLDDDDHADDDSGDDDTGDDDDSSAQTTIVLQASTPSGVEVSLEIDTGFLDDLGLDPEDFSISSDPLDPAQDPSCGFLDEIGDAVIHLEPDGVDFPSPVVMRLEIPDELLTEEHANPGVATWNATTERWEAVQMVLNGDEEGTYQALLPHFSDYLIFAALPRPNISISPFAGDDHLNLYFSLFEGAPDSTEDLLSIINLNGSQELCSLSPTESDFLFSCDLQGAGRVSLEFIVGSWPNEVFLWSREFIYGQAVSSDAYEEEITRYAPSIQFHPSENWLPVSLGEEYFQTELSIESNVVAGGIDLAGQDAMEAMHVSGYTDALLTSREFGNIDASTEWGDSGESQPGSDDISVSVSVHVHAGGATETVYLTYWMFYRHDPKSTAWWDIHESYFGRHDRDRESATVVLECEDGVCHPTEVIFAGHRSIDEMMVAGHNVAWQNGAIRLSWDDIDRYTTHPVIYIAEGSHAVYPRALSYEVDVPEVVVIWDPNETAGGGFTYCAPDDDLCSQLADSPATGEYNLDSFPVFDEMVAGAEWQHLAFSGFWVDGQSDSRFPPYIERYHSVHDWAGDLDLAESNLLSDLGDASPFDDNDGDGYSPQAATDPDCDDEDFNINPGATEVACDGEDNDCDVGTPDDVDADGDGWSGCTDDCEDGDPDINPGETEVACDGEDNDCDESTPDEPDADGDGWSTCAGDCDDNDGARNPGLTEVTCDGVDNDCEASTVDEPDDDGDGWTICAGDLDDGNDEVYPGAPEICDGVLDNSCDGVDDPNETDDDGDSMSECDGDCDDTNSAVYDGAPEVCDGELDNSCDGVDDPNETDDDGDGQAECDGDCNDGDIDIYGNAAEICSDATDYDCDGDAQCTDPDCAFDVYCLPPEDCEAAGDEDLDGLEDCDDPDCDNYNCCVYAGFQPQFVGTNVDDTDIFGDCGSLANNEDEQCNPGERCQLEVEILNPSCEWYDDVDGEASASYPLSFDAPDDIFFDADVYDVWGTLAPGYSTDGSGEFCVDVDPGATCDTTYDIDVDVWDDLGRHATITIPFFVHCGGGGGLPDLEPLTFSAYYAPYAHSLEYEYFVLNWGGTDVSVAFYNSLLLDPDTTFMNGNEVHLCNDYIVDTVPAGGFAGGYSLACSTSSVTPGTYHALFAVDYSGLNAGPISELDESNNYWYGGAFEVQ